MYNRPHYLIDRPARLHLRSIQCHLSYRNRRETHPMPHDALSQILDALKLRGSIYFHTHFNPPWSVRVPAYGNVTRFHMAMRAIAGCRWTVSIARCICPPAT